MPHCDVLRYVSVDCCSEYHLGHGSRSIPVPSVIQPSALVDFVCPVIPPSSAPTLGSSQRPFPFAAKCVNKVVPMVPQRLVSDDFVDIDNMPEECEAVAHLAALSIPTLRMFVEHLEQQFKVRFSRQT